MTWLLLMLLLAPAGCGKQAEEVSPPTRSERPQRRPRPVQQTDLVPVDDVQPAAPTTSESLSGIVYRNDWIRNVPWSVNLITIDRSRSDLELNTTLGRGRTLGLSPLTAQLEALPSELGRPIAAVNGDFYRTEHESFAGDPRGLQIMRGELISAPIGKTSFWVDAQRQPHIDNVSSKFEVIWPSGEKTPFGLNEERRANSAVLYTPRTGPSTRARGGRELILTRHGEGPWLPLQAGQTYSAVVKEIRDTGNSRVNADTLVLSIGPTLLARVPKLAQGAVLQISTATSPDLSGAKMAIGGGPVLLHQGKIQSTYVNKAHERHPRSAMGWNDTSYFLVQVDGRQHGFSDGMDLPELAAYMAKQGCKEAMNLDGGGSSEMWLDGQVVNRPCFGHERSTANGLVLLQLPK